MNDISKNKNRYIPHRLSLTEKARENRNNPSKAEKKTWYEILRNKEFGNYKFIRQKPLDNYIVDFYCSKLMLAIEIDGDSHCEQKDYDELRTEKLGLYGIEIIRYANFDILENIESVYEDLKKRIIERKVVCEKAGHF